MRAEEIEVGAVYEGYDGGRRRVRDFGGGGCCDRYLYYACGPFLHRNDAPAYEWTWMLVDDFARWAVRRVSSEESKP